ncbi:MAG: cytochrome [Thermoleophilia bacterium]|nr:cytochrome [Thermoleophilia bacterium]
MYARTTDRYRRGAALLLVLAVALLVSACGGDSKDGDSGKTGTAPTASTSTNTETAATNTEAVSGKSVFLNNCTICHGQKGTGGNGGPDISSQSDAAHNIEQVSNGGGGMPAFKGQLSDEEIKAVADFVAGGLKS